MSNGLVAIKSMMQGVKIVPYLTPDGVYRIAEAAEKAGINKKVYSHL